LLLQDRGSNFKRQSVLIINKNIHGHKVYAGEMFCSDCFESLNIAHRQLPARTTLLAHDVQFHKTNCALCDVALIVDGIAVKHYERDHVDVFTKIESVGFLVMIGAPLEDILAENDKCRNLCVPCHCLVTYAERAVGILKLKSLPGNEEVRRRAAQQVAEVVAFLSNYIFANTNTN
jgi:hypothetical protein